MSSSDGAGEHRVNETGPVYGVRLLDELPLRGTSGMKQALPGRADLALVLRVNGRTAAGYEVLLAHYHDQCAEVSRLKDVIRTVIDGHWSTTQLQEAIGDLTKRE